MREGSEILQSDCPHSTGYGLVQGSHGVLAYSEVLLLPWPTKTRLLPLWLADGVLWQPLLYTGTIQISPYRR